MQSQKHDIQVYLLLLQRFEMCLTLFQRLKTRLLMFSELLLSFQTRLDGDPVSGEGLVEVLLDALQYSFELSLSLLLTLCTLLLLARVVNV